MEQKSMMEKVRVRRPRAPTATPKERAAWQVFLAMAAELQGDPNTGINSLLQSELDRLAAKGNPIAIRFKERVSIASFKPREAHESTSQPPSPKRNLSLKWGRPSDTKIVSDELKK